MTSLAVGPPASASLGDQRPRILHVPPSVTSAAGEEAVDLAAQAGLVLDDWQQFALRSALAERADHKWAAFEVGLVVSRQNGKGSILEARELAGLFLLNEGLQIHSAHLFDTSLEAFRRILEIIETNPWLDSKVKRVSKSHGEEGIELKSRQRLRFKTRTAGGGRGLSGDAVYLDEAMILPDKVVGALMPTMSAKSVQGNPQLWYTASAGTEDSTVLARLRRRGIKGEDPSLCYLEWSVDEAAYLADPAGVARDEDAWAQANPGLGIRISAEHVAREQRSMDPLEFSRERLGVGTWPLDESEGGAIRPDDWAACRDEASRFGPGPAPLGVYFTGDRATAYVAAVGAREDKLAHAELLAEVPATQALDAVLQLHKKRRALVVIDPGSHAGSLIQPLEAAGVEVEQVTLQKLGQASGTVYDTLAAHTLRHIGQPKLDAAARTATTRPIGRDAWAWKGPAVAPLVAVTLAMHGYASTGPGDGFNIW